MFNRFQAGTLVCLAAISLAFAGLVPAEAGERRYRAQHSGYYAGPDGRGCYWMRQRLYCARYCYIEADGRRYCRERSRYAFPQAPYYDDDLEDPRRLK